MARASTTPNARRPGRVTATWCRILPVSCAGGSRQPHRAGRTGPTEDGAPMHRSGTMALMRHRPSALRPVSLLFAALAARRIGRGAGARCGRADHRPPGADPASRHVPLPCRSPGEVSRREAGGAHRPAERPRGGGAGGRGGQRARALGAAGGCGQRRDRRPGQRRLDSAGSTVEQPVGAAPGARPEGVGPRAGRADDDRGCRRYRRPEQASGPGRAPGAGS